MIVKIDKSFEKDVNKVNDRSLLNKIADCIEEVRDAHKLSEV